MGIQTQREAVTRRHLLDAAGEVFAEKGYRDATIRDICNRAGANVAAVNYHFGDKAALYAEVLADLSEIARERFPITLDLPPQATPQERLHAFVRSFLWRVLSSDLAARHGRLMAREMVEPTGALDRLVEERIRPEAEALRGIITEILGPDAPRDQIQLAGLSVVGQILFYSHCAPVLNRLFREDAFDVTRLERLADHITTFSLAAMDGLSGRTVHTRAEASTQPRRQPKPRSRTRPQGRRRPVRTV